MKTLLSWSSGKDSAWALYLLQHDLSTDLQGLFTVINKKFNRVSMHATRLNLVNRQAKAANLPIQIIALPDPCTSDQYNAIMRQFITESAAKGIERIAFGDIFLENVRRYRENQLADTGIKPFFPLWGISTTLLVKQILAAGIEAYISSVDLQKLPAHYAGQKWSRKLLKEIPKKIDPCGENGEMHTVVVGGPMFCQTIPVIIGEIVERDGFAYADIMPES